MKPMLRFSLVLILAHVATLAGAQTTVDPGCTRQSLFNPYPAMTIVGGHPAIAYTSCASLPGDDLMFVRATHADGSSWGTPVVVEAVGSNNTGQLPSMAMVNGRPAIVYKDNTTLDMKYVRAGDANGSTWGTPIALDGISGSTNLSLAVVDGNPAIAYIRPPNTVHFVRANDADGTTWGTPVEVIPSDVHARGISLVVVDGNPAIAYAHGSLETRFVRATDSIGASWGAPVTAGHEPWAFIGMKIVNGRPAIGYYCRCSADGWWNLAYVRANDASGSSWGTPLFLENDGTEGTSASLAVILGKPAMAYVDSDTSESKFIHALDADGTSWGSPVVFGGTTSNTFALEVDGGRAVAYHGSILYVDSQVLGSPPAEPELQVATAIPGAELETVAVALDLTANGESIAATTFSVDYDETCLAFDDTDGDADNIPDAIAFSVPAGFSVTAFHDLGDTDGEIDVSITDLAPPIATLPDGTLLTITFTGTCEPAVDATIVAPVGFSTDPAATFSDDLAVDVAGTTTDGSVEIWPGPRGDCNRNDNITAADLIAEALEIFDGDGDFWADVVVNVPFAGSPMGCDANDDATVNAGDISCTILLIFGGSCGGGSPFTGPGFDQAFDPRSAPLLGLKGAYRDRDGTLWLPVVFSPGAHPISSVAFSLDLADKGVVFDPFDGDGDGIPDAVRFGRGGRPDWVEVRYDAADPGGELDLALADFDGVLAEGLLLEVAVRPLWNGAGFSVAGQLVGFAETPAASFGNVYGQAVLGRTLDSGGK